MKVRKIYKRAEQQVERSLDVRNIYQMQGLLKTLTTAIFDKKHRPLIKYQRHVNHLSLSSSSNSDADLFDPDRDKNNEKEKLILQGIVY